MNLKNLFKKEKKELTPLQKKKRKKRIIRWGIFLVIVLIFIINAINNSGKVPSMENSTLSKVSKETIATSIGATGTIESSSSKIVTSKLTGLTVSQVFVKNGDVVNSGDPICEFDVSDIQKALDEQHKQEREAKAEQARAEREQKEQEEELRKSLDEAKKEADNNSKATEKELEKAKKDRDTAKANVDKAQKELDAYLQSENTRVTNTISNTTTNTVSNRTVANTIANAINNRIGNITNQASDALEVDAGELARLQQNLATANAAYTEANTTVSELEDRLDGEKEAANIDVNSVVNSMKSISGVTNLASTITSLSNANVNTSDLSSLASSMSGSSSLLSSLGMGSFSNMSYEDMIANRVVTAPASGTITNLSVTEDATFSGTEVCLIEGAESLCVSSEIGEYDIPDIKEGMKVRIKTEATRNQELDGIITSVATTPTSTGLNSLSNLMSSSMMSGMMSGSSSSSSSSTGGVSYTIKVDIITPSDRLRLGMNAKMSIITNMKENVLSVPYDAVNTRDDGSKYIVTVADDFDIEKIAEEKKKTKMLNATRELEKTAIPNELLEGQTKEINVETGIEGTYNVEISSNEIYENMNVVLNKSSVSNSIEALLEMMGAAAGT